MPRRPCARQRTGEKTLERTLAHLPAEAEVLELGCGTGSTALRLAPHVARYVGTDDADAMIAIAQEKLAAEPVAGLSFAAARPGDGSLPPGPFDAVTAFNLLHLLPDLPAALAEMRGLLEARRAADRQDALSRRALYRALAGGRGPCASSARRRRCASCGPTVSRATIEAAGFANRGTRRLPGARRRPASSWPDGFDSTAGPQYRAVTAPTAPRRDTRPAMTDLPEFYFRIRENGAAVYRVLDREPAAADRDDRDRGREHPQRQTSGPHGDHVLTDAEQDAIARWMEETPRGSGPARSRRHPPHDRPPQPDRAVGAVAGLRRGAWRK